MTKPSQTPEPIYDAECGCCMNPETREKYEELLKATPEANSRVKTVEEQIDIALANLVFSGLSIAQIDKIPKWLLENIEKNKPTFKKTLTQERHSIHTSLVEAVEGKKKDSKKAKESKDGELIAAIIGYNHALDDTLTIINSIFKE